MRDSHRGEAERLLERAVDEAVRRGPGGVDAAGAGVERAVLLARGREALDSLAASAAPEYEAYVRALDEAAAGEQSLGEAFRRGNTSTAAMVTAVAAATAVGADLSLGVAAGTALTAGAVVGVAGAVATVVKVTALHLPAANRRAGELGRPGGAEQLRLQWLTALEVRGIRPFLEQQRAVAAAARAPRPAAGVSMTRARSASQLRGVDRSAEARRRSALEQSFGQLPDAAGRFTGRRAELTRIAQWVQAARASTETRPVVVVLYGEPGVGRTTLALRAAHALRDQFRGACVVDLRGGSPGPEPGATAGPRASAGTGTSASAGTAADTTGTGAGAGTSTGAGAAPGTAAYAVTGPEAGPGTGIGGNAKPDTSAGAGTGSSVSAGPDTGTGIGAGAGSDTSAGAVASVEPDASAKTHAGAGTAIGATAGAIAGTGIHNGAGTETGSGAGAGAGSGTGAGVGAAVEPSLGTGGGPGTGTAAEGGLGARAEAGAHDGADTGTVAAVQPGLGAGTETRTDAAAGTAFGTGVGTGAGPAAGTGTGPASEAGPNPRTQPGAPTAANAGASSAAGGSTPEPPAPLSTREALLHLLNRLGAPREQLLFREGASAEQQVRRLGELYHQHLQGLPVTVLLDDAVDAEQVRVLVPERSESLVLVTARAPMELPADLAAWVHQLPVERLDAAEAAELLKVAAPAPLPAAGDPAALASALDSVVELSGGLPLALRILAPLVADGGVPGGGFVAGGAAHPVEAALRAAEARLAEPARLLLRRLPLAGRASLGGAAAAALADVPESAALRTLEELGEAGLIERVRGQRFRMHDAVRAYAAARLAADGDRAEATAAHERLIRTYAQLADAVIRMVDGKMSTRANQFDGHGFTSLDAALRWLDDESSFITAALRHAEDVDQQAVLDLLGALCDFCLLRGDLYRLGEIDELTRAVTAGHPGRAASRGRLARSVQWRTGIAARQLGELDKARTTLTSVVDQYMEARQEAGAAMALISLGITLHHQGNLPEAAVRIREALVLQQAPELAGDRAWGLHALAAVERDQAHLAEAERLLETSLALHRENESVHGEAWAHFQLGQVRLRHGDVARAEEELERALHLYGRTRDDRGEAWALTQLGRARVVAGDPGPAVERLREALARHREAEDVRGEAWTQYYLGQALEVGGERDEAVRELERARTMFSRMRDVYGLAHARHHSGRVTRDQRAARTGNLRNSGFARQLLVDARADFQRIGLAHGEAWTCVELAVVDAGNGRLSQALGLCEEAVRLFISYGDRRGEDWARFLRCTLLPYAGPGGPGATEEARAELARLAQTRHPARDGRLEDCLETYGVVLGRGVDPTEGWQAWRLGLIPNLHSRELMGVPRP